MPFFGKKKADTKDSKGGKVTHPKSQFYDNNDNKPAVNVRSSSGKGKKDRPHSKSTFYKEAECINDFADTASINSNSSATSNPSQSTPNYDLKLQNDIGHTDATKDVWSRRTSILSRSFHDCLHDKELIAYFIQFMSSKDNGALIRFWFDAEHFTTAFLSRLKENSLQKHLPNLADQTSGANEIETPSHNIPTVRRKSTLEDSLERIEKDAVNIYSKYIALDCASPIDISEEIRNSTISKICSEDGKVDPMCFKECQTFVEQALNKEYYQEFLESPYYRKYQIDILTGGNIQLLDILYNDNAMFYFMEYMEQEQASKLIQFWMGVDNFQGQMESPAEFNTSKDAQADAMILYEKYFSLQAADPLGFSDKVRIHVELNICREGGPLPDCFVIPKTMILQTIDKTLFQPFLQSQMYYRFLSELINSVQSSATGQTQGTPKIHKRTVSNASFDTHSVDSHGLLDGHVSAGSSYSDLRSTGSSSRLAGIDDDLPLWRRERHRKSMSLGLLSEFGQFTSELELSPLPDIDKKKGNRFSRKKKEKEKAQEDMAWQIARMIISDVNKEVSGCDAMQSFLPKEPEEETTPSEQDT